MTSTPEGGSPVSADGHEPPRRHPDRGGRARQRFDVVVPLSQADYEGGSRTCRYEINPTGSD